MLQITLQLILTCKRLVRTLNPRKTHLSKILYDVNIKSMELENGFKLLKMILAPTPFSHILMHFLSLHCFVLEGREREIFQDTRSVCGVVLFHFFHHSVLRLFQE